MNATTNFTVKSLRANRVRTLVTIAGVALAAALLTAVLTTFVSLNDFLYRNEAALAGTWMACVEADDSSVLDERITGAQADPQVSGTAIMRDIGFAELTADQQDQVAFYGNSAPSRAMWATSAASSPARGACPRTNTRSCSSPRGMTTAA